MKGFTKNIRLLSLLTVVFLSILSCSKEEQKKPDFVLSHAEMVKTLTEVYIAEQKVSRLSLDPDSAARVFGTMEKKVFENLNVPDSVFRASIDYYMDHPKEMDAIYSTLIDSLQLLEQRTPQIYDK